MFKMITEMGKGKKVFMVLFMLVVFFSLIVWLIKKFSELKEEADKRRAKENEERHAESAIFEEQEEKHTREEEMQERKTNMKNDFKLYNKYVNFLPQHTWSKYSIDKDMAIKKTKTVRYRLYCEASAIGTNVILSIFNKGFPSNCYFSKRYKIFYFK